MLTQCQLFNADSHETLVFLEVGAEPVQARHDHSTNVIYNSTAKTVPVNNFFGVICFHEHR